MADTILPQDGATTQTTATPAAGTTPPAQDFQINLAEVTEQSEGIPQGGTPKTEIPQPLAENTQTASNLDLDLNLPEIPKNDDRLKVEDEHNEIAKENITPTTTEPVIQPVVEPIIEPTIPATEPVIEPVAPVAEPVIEPAAPVAEPVAPVAESVIEPAAEIKEITTPDTSMNNLPEKNSLENDMKMIESLQ